MVLLKTAFPCLMLPTVLKFQAYGFYANKLAGFMMNLKRNHESCEFARDKDSGSCLKKCKQDYFMT